MGVAIAHNLLQQGIQTINLIAVQQFKLLLNTCLNSFKAGNVEPGRRIFQLLQPCRIQPGLFTNLDILFNAPMKFFKLSSSQPFPGIGQADLVVHRKTGIPAFNFLLNGTLCIQIQFFHVLNGLLGFSVGAVLQDGKPPTPIIRISHGPFLQS